jgi:hypothetical protein
MIRKAILKSSLPRDVSYIEEVVETVEEHGAQLDFIKDASQIEFSFFKTKVTLQDLFGQLTVRTDDPNLIVMPGDANNIEMTTLDIVNKHMNQNKVGFQKFEITRVGKTRRMSYMVDALTVSAGKHTFKFTILSKGCMLISSSEGDTIVINSVNQNTIALTTRD